MVQRLNHFSTIRTVYSYDKMQLTYSFEVPTVADYVRPAGGQYEVRIVYTRKSNCNDVWTVWLTKLLTPQNYWLNTVLSEPQKATTV